MENKKITLATFKSFVNKNKENLLINNVSSFDGMHDCVMNNENESFEKIKETDRNVKNTLGVSGLWLVGSSRDYFAKYEDEQYTGIEVYNSCGSQIVVVKK